MRDMLGREEVITVEHALELIFNNLSPKLPPEENLKIYESYGMILSRDILSPEDLPNFSRSTVDGFAVSAPDTFGAGNAFLPEHAI
jgi:molybdopterin molybdotransferase